LLTAATAWDLIVWSMPEPCTAATMSATMNRRAMYSTMLAPRSSPV
jgi:hypothetical protein